MGFSEESFYKSTYRKIHALMAARLEYIKKTNGDVGNSDNEQKAIQKLDSILG